MSMRVTEFFQDIFNFLKSGSVLGIDIGTASIKAVELSKKGEKLKLVNYGILETKSYLEHPNQAIHTASLKLVEEETVKLLEVILREVKPKAKIAIVSIPNFSAFVTLLDMPLLSQEETSHSIGYQARQLIPLPVSEVAIDWVKVDEFDSPRGGRFQRLLLIGVPNEIIRKYKSIFHKLGLRLTAMEVESFALTRAVPPQRKPTLIVDMGAESTSICVTEAGVLKYSGQTDYGGVYLTQALSRSLGITNLRAEELKRRRGLLGTGGELELSTLILSFLDVIIQEVRHVQDLYERRYSKKVESAILLGGGANLLGIDKYFTNQTNLPVTGGAVFAGIDYASELTPAVKNLSNIFPVAVGLAKRYFAE